MASALHPSDSALQSSKVAQLLNDLVSSSSTSFTPAPQPSLSIDTLASMSIISALFTMTSWYFLCMLSFTGNSVLSAISFSLFLFSTLSFLSSQSRMSSELSREHKHYMIPLGLRNYMHHTSTLLGFAFFYLGILTLIGIAAWTLVESKRTIAGVVTTFSGGAAVLVGAILHYRALTHPLGIITTHTEARAAEKEQRRRRTQSMGELGGLLVEIQRSGAEIRVGGGGAEGEVGRNDGDHEAGGRQEEVEAETSVVSRPRRMMRSGDDLIIPAE